MSPVDFKNAPCRPVEFEKKRLCRPVNFRGSTLILLTLLCTDFGVRIPSPT